MLAFMDDLLCAGKRNIPLWGIAQNEIYPSFFAKLETRGLYSAKSTGGFHQRVRRSPREEERGDWDGACAGREGWGCAAWDASGGSGGSEACCSGLFGRAILHRRTRLHC